MKTLADFQPLKPAEEKLLECCQSGEVAVIEKERPTEKTYANEIRADFLRWLILFSKVNIDPNGIMLHGAWISDWLDLDNAECPHTLTFLWCVFEETFCLRRANTKTIYMDGSLCQKGISADGLICHGNFHFRSGYSTEEVRFSGAKIEGNFDFTNANFKVLNEQQIALNCDGIYVVGFVFLRNKFSADGEVRFSGAIIKKDFDCTNATFKVNNKKQKALNCNGMNVCQGIILRDKCTILNGIIDFTYVLANALVDDKAFWQQESLQMAAIDGFQYKHIYSDDITAFFRLKNMLGKMPNFFPQPYKQLAKVLRDMGHIREADDVMIDLNDKRFITKKEELQKTKVCNFLSWLYIKLQVVWMPIKCFFSYNLSICGLKTSQLLWLLYKWTSAYGYRPMRTLKIMASVWFIFGCIYWYGANVAVFAPTNPLIFQASAKYKNCKVDENGTKWLASPKDYNESNNWYIASPAEYTTFQPFWYSLDIILPVVDLKMENDWGIVIPSPEGNWTDMIPFTTTNHFIRFLTWVESLIGWGLSLMLVAILSGLAKNEKSNYSLHVKW